MSGEATTGQDERTRIAPTAFGARLSLLYSAFFFHVGIYLPYFPLWLKGQGLSAPQISVVLSLPLAVRVLTSGSITSHADRARDRANVVIVLYALAALAAMGYLFTASFWPILAVTALLAVFTSPIVPILDSLTLSGVRRFGADYGRIRLWGSLIFIIANIGGGLVLAGREVDSVLYVFLAGIAAGALLSPLLPRIGRPRKTAGAAALADANMWKLLRNRRFLSIVLASGLLQASHAMIYGFGSIYWESTGYSGTTIGALWATGVVAEVVLFRYSRAVLRWSGPLLLVAIGAAGAMLRWSLMPFEPPLAGFFVLQSLHGLSFGAVHLGTMHFLVDSVAEDRMGAAQGATFVLGGLVMAIAIFSSGPLYAMLGVDAFVTMAAVAGLALVLVLANMRDQPQRAGLGGDTSAGE